MIDSLFWVTGFLAWLAIGMFTIALLKEWAMFVIKRQREAYPRSKTGLSRREYYWTLFRMAIYDAKRYWKDVS